MSKLNIDQQTIKELFQNKRSDFLIPDYQRPYAWGLDECQTLWDDIFAFAFPDGDESKFNIDDEYFLGPIVTFKNERGKLEIIDGQQRLTTLMLLLRAFYEHFGSMKDSSSVKTAEAIAGCIWKTNEFGAPNKEQLKIDSEVSTDDDKDEFLNILKSGRTNDEQRSRYAQNYRFFTKQIDKFLQEYPSYFAYLPARIMNNCILLPIEAESQDTALRIFSTLNDRGKPLSDTDIFKAQLYKYYSDMGQKNHFIERWKKLEDICDEIFPSDQSSPMDELFTRYMYYIRAKMGIKDTTTTALRKFYEQDKYAILKNDKTLSDLERLASFWQLIYSQDSEAFDKATLRKLGILQYAPNSMWTYMVTAYFFANAHTDGTLDSKNFCEFLDTITGFIFAYAVVRPGVNSLRQPVYPELIKIVNGEKVDFAENKLDPKQVRGAIDNYSFTNQRGTTKSMLVWWAYQNSKQEVIPAKTLLDIEHIYPRKRQENESGLSTSRLLEALGNKTILERRINIRAADYRLSDKRKYYEGFVTDKGRKREGTIIADALEIARTYNDFTEADIVARNKQIIDAFMEFLNRCHLLNSEAIADA